MGLRLRHPGGEAALPLHQVVVVVEAVVAGQDPFAVELVGGLGRAALDHVEVQGRDPVRVGEQELLHAVEGPAQEEAQAQRRGGDPVDADPARLHGRDLVAPGQHPEGHEHRHQDGDRGNEVDDLEDAVRVVVHDHPALHPVLLDVVEEVHELGQEEDRGEGEQDQGEEAHPAAGDVAVEQGGEPQDHAGEAEDQDRPRGGGGGIRIRALPL